MKILAMSVILSALAAQALAQTTLSLKINTGGDDLRGGNNAFLSFVRADGSVTSEQSIGGGFGNWSQTDKTVIFPESLDLGAIRSIGIRHDGSPRSGNPFDSYDNWDLRFLTVRVLDGPIVYDSSLDSARFEFIQRFTGDTRTKTIALLPAASEVDFIVSSVRRVPRGFAVRVTNQGAAGVVTGVWCRTLSRGTPRRVFRTVHLPLASGGRSESTVTWVHLVGDRVACYADGQDATGVAEVVTAGNGRMFP